ncbi:hypothetical protein TcasGA2_TC003631 [Tribolium castaneum]|uniref:Uncharacterized protein n=1 Tax=Tribolium castaneum TaxID=7070 RepID=D6WIL4_TRICA|nr:hypothetical protein TcasGA2_TC003631 [Tribolium castaneum]
MRSVLKVFIQQCDDSRVINATKTRETRTRIDDPADLGEISVPDCNTRSWSLKPSLDLTDLILNLPQRRHKNPRSGDNFNRDQLSVQIISTAINHDIYDVFVACLTKLVSRHVDHPWPLLKKPTRQTPRRHVYK